MKKRELVQGKEYALIVRDPAKRATRRKGIPDCEKFYYMGDSHPGIQTRKDQVLMYRRWSGQRVMKIELVRPTQLWCSWEKYEEIQEQYDKKEEMRAQANRRAAEYLQEHLSTLYTWDDVYFDSENGVFHVSPKVMAELHGLPVPGKIEVPDAVLVPAPNQPERTEVRVTIPGGVNG